MESTTSPYVWAWVNERRGRYGYKLTNWIEEG